MVEMGYPVIKENNYTIWHKDKGLPNYQKEALTEFRYHFSYSDPQMNLGFMHWQRLRRKSKVILTK